MFRVFAFLVLLAVALTAVRYAILFLLTPGVRRSIAADKGVDAFAPSVEPELSDWRRGLGNRLWLQLVALPVAVFLILLIVGEYS